MSFLHLWTKQLWLYFMLLTGSGVTYFLYQNWQIWPPAQKLSAAIYIVLPLHAWEEFRFPGGYAYQYNWIRGKSTSPNPDRFPMNQLTHMLMFVLGTVYGMVLLWIGAGPAILTTRLFVALVEVLVHVGDGVKMKKKFAAKGKTSIYNPGLVTTVIGFLPILVAGVVVLVREGMGVGDVLKAVALLVPAVAITMVPERIVDRKRDAEWAYEPGYYKRFVAK